MLWAQSHSYGGGVGVMRYHGDLPMAASPPLPMAFLSYHRNLSDHFSWGARFLYGNLKADDQKKPDWQWRNLNFASPVAAADWEITFNFKRFLLNVRSARGTLFLSGGVSVVYYNPSMTIDGRKYLLQGRWLEEEGKVTAIGTMGFPFGLGYKQMLGERMFVQVGVRAYPLLTDYLDGVKGHFPADLPQRDALTRRLSNPTVYSDEQVSGLLRGNPQNKDWFFTAAVSIYYVVRRTECVTF